MIKNFADRVSAVLQAIDHEEWIPGWSVDSGGKLFCGEIPVRDEADTSEEEVTAFLGGAIALLWARWKKGDATGHFLSADGSCIVSVFHRGEQFPREWAKAPTDFEAVLIVLEQTLGLAPKNHDGYDDGEDHE